jgi:hypothetical protein
MTTKSLLCTAVLTLASLTAASARSYDIILSSPAKAGPIELKAGSYSVTVKGDIAVFKNAASGKTYSAPVKVETQGPKHDSTVAKVETKNGADVLSSIAVGGSNTTLEFSE